MVGAIFEGIISTIFQIIFEIFFMGTGEIILYILTAGKRKPVWKRDHNESVVKIFILFDLSVIIGFVFWVSIAWLIFNKLSQ